MSDSESDSELPDFIKKAAKTIQLSLLPAKSKQRYTAAYNDFKKWRKNKKVGTSFAEEVFLVYFGELAENYAPPTLWSKYSMIKACV